MNYSDRIVCFLDVLGFSEHIKKTVAANGTDDVDSISSLVEALRGAREILRIDRQPRLGLSQKCTTQFSDSIVISFRVDKESGVFFMLREILCVQLNLLRHGMLCRGAITRGKLMHSSDVLFGPGFNDAYELESKAASYPRVILNQEIIEAGVIAHSSHHGPEDELENIMEFLSCDGDGMFYIDYITKALCEMDNPNEHPAYLSRLRDIVVAGIKNPNPSVRVKYFWLKTKFNPYLAMVKARAQTSPTDTRNQAYLAIPDLEDA
jgi:hypothetical protein